MTWIKKYNRIAFKDKGRNLSGVDCWGLVRLIYANELHIELPSYGEISSEELRKVSEEIEKGSASAKWLDVSLSDLQEFDVMVMRFHGHRMIGHVGIVTPCKKIMHIERNSNVMIVSANDMSIKNRIVGLKRFSK